MKKLEARIKADRLEVVCETLHQSNVIDFTIMECGNFGATGKHVRSTRTGNMAPDLLPMIVVEIVVATGRLTAVVDAIVQSGGLDIDRPGHLLVSSVDTVVRIRNGERGENALG